MHIEAVLTFVWLCQNFKPVHRVATTKGKRARVPSTYAVVVWLRHLRLTYRTCLAASAFVASSLLACGNATSRHRHTAGQTNRQIQKAVSPFPFEKECHAHCHSQFSEWYLPFSSINLPQFPPKRTQPTHLLLFLLAVAQFPIES